MLAVWSRASRNSDWVRAEASLGNDANKLVQVVLHKDVRPPLPFNVIHYEPLERGPRASDENWSQLLEAVRLQVGGAQAARAPARSPNPVNAASVLSSLSALGLLAYILSLYAPGVAAMLERLPAIGGDPQNLPLYAAAAFGAGAILVTLQRIAAVLAAGR